MIPDANIVQKTNKAQPTTGNSKHNFPPSKEIEALISFARALPYVRAYNRERLRVQADRIRRLDKAGINVVWAEGKNMYRCRSCRHHWVPETKPNGRLQNGHWKCPHGCNTKKAHAS